MLVETDTTGKKLRMWSAKGPYAIQVDLSVPEPGRVEISLNGIPHETITWERVQGRRRLSPEAKEAVENEGLKERLGKRSRAMHSMHGDPADWMACYDKDCASDRIALGLSKS